MAFGQVLGGVSTLFPSFIGFPIDPQLPATSGKKGHRRTLRERFAKNKCGCCHMTPTAITRKVGYEGNLASIPTISGSGYATMPEQRRSFDCQSRSALSSIKYFDVTCVNGIISIFSMRHVEN
jgi:hypothetical protein